MLDQIERDNARFKKIVRGKIKENLKKYITKGELIGKKGKDKISIPVPRINIPRFRYGDDGSGFGQGEGPGDGQEAGDKEGEHMLEVDVSLDELADLLGEELELPNIEPKGKKGITTSKDKWSSVSTVGPDGLRIFKRTYKEALKRQIAAGEYDPKNPIITPIRKDARYKDAKLIEIPETCAVIIYMMDVSGSMGEEQKEIVRLESFWIDLWLQHNYDNLETRYIIHDASANEVDKETFYTTKESGGTKISSAYNLCNDIIDKDYNPNDWNIYPFHFSDGDNWGDDNNYCVETIKQMIPKINFFGYGQVQSRWGSGDFIKILYKHFTDAIPKEEKVVTSRIEGREEIVKSIQELLGSGR